MKRFATVLALTCVLSTSIFAGDMPTTGKAEPAPPAATPSTLLASVVVTIITVIR